MPLTIRPAVPADIAAIAGIYADAVRDGTASFELEPPREAEMAARMRALLDAGYPYLAAERAGGLVGYAYAGAYRARPAYRWTVEDSVYIDRAAQGQGIGRALLDELIGQCGARGYRQMIAVIGDSPRQAGSVALHRACGFALVGILQDVGFKHGHWCDSMLMQRALGEGAASHPGDILANPPSSRPA